MKKSRKPCKVVYLNDDLDRRARLVRAGLDPVDFDKVLVALAKRYEHHDLNKPVELPAAPPLVASVQP